MRRRRLDQCIDRLGSLGANFGASAPTLFAGLTLGALELRTEPGAVRECARTSRQRADGDTLWYCAFFGAALAIVLLSEPITMSLIVAVVLTALSTWLVLTERHSHVHTHEPKEQPVKQPFVKASR